MLITNVHILPIGNTKEIKNGYIFVENDRIVATGAMEEAPRYQDELDGEGCFAIPAFIEPHSHIGLFKAHEQDACETGRLATPQYRVIDSLNLKDEYWAEALKSGILTTIVSPSCGSVISGQLAAVDAHAVVSRGEYILRAPIGVKCSLGENPKKANLVETRMAEVSIIREILARASKYPSDKKTEYDFELESLKPVIKKKMPLYIHAHTIGDINAAIRIAEEFNINIVLIHATSSEEIAAKLVEMKYPVICGPQINTKVNPELADFTPALPAILSVNNVKVAIMTNHPDVPITGLALSAGLAVKAGMPPLDALEAITIRAAEVCGISDILGSIEADKIANILLYSKFPLDFYAVPEKIIAKGCVLNV
ncbi:MAG: amidohydrolase family protein [Oscillospiraceae bacterium]|nr:amidohydrolase family protein [Oscillospiraceae bacterium]